MRRRDFLQKTSLAVLGVSLAPRILLTTNEEFPPSLPFTDINGMPSLITDEYGSLDEHVLTTVADTLCEAKQLYSDEYSAVEANLSVRKKRLQPYIDNITNTNSWHNPHLEDANKKPLKLRTNTLTTKEESFLHDVEFFGRELTNPSNKYRYDPTWTKSLQEKFDLRPTDCTRYLLESYANATKDKTLLEDYLNHTYKSRTFPWVFAMYFKKDYETIMIIPDTKSEERYYNGSLSGGFNKQVMENLKKEWYYTSTDYKVVPKWFRKEFLGEHGLSIDDDLFDYYVLDEQTKTDSFKKFIQRNSGIGIKQEFVHVQLFNGDDLYEAQWGNNPLYANTFEKSSLYDRLHSVGDDKIHNIVLWVPRGTVQTHLHQMQQEYYLDTIQPRRTPIPSLQRVGLE